jgi:hypothetical protein
MADPIDDLHAVFAMGGITDNVMRANIIAQKGFTQLEDLGVLKTDTNVSTMAKRIATRTQAKGRVLLGMVMIKGLQTLVWWVRDQQKQGLTLDAADFDAAAMNQASKMKTLQCEWAEKEPSILYLGKFDPNNFICMKTLSLTF